VANISTISMQAVAIVGMTHPLLFLPGGAKHRSDLPQGRHLNRNGFRPARFRTFRDSY
jgi:hypothetical protein